MPSREQIVRAVETYIDRFSAGDAEAWSACFAEHGTHEDPVGTPVNEGRAAITAAYEQSLAIGGGTLRLVKRDDPIVIGDEAIVALEAWAGTGSDRLHMPRIIDHFRFDDDGRITSLRAFWEMDRVEADPE